MFFFEATLAKNFGPEKYGDYQYLISVATILSAICSFGLPQFAVREAKKNLIKEDQSASSFLFIYCPLLIVFFSSLVSIVIGFLPALVSFLLSIKLFYRRIFQGIGKLPEAIVIDEFIFAVVLIGLLNFFVTSNPIHYQLIAILSCVIIYIIRARKYYLKKTPYAEITFKKISYLILGGGHFILFVFSQYGLRKIDSIIIQPILGANSVGVFSSAMKISAVAIFISLIINSVVGDKLSELYYQSEIKKLARLFELTMDVSAFIGGAICLFIYFFAENVIFLFFGAEYTDAIPLLKILIFGQFINISSGPCMQLFSLTDESGFLVKISIVILLLSFLLFYSLTSLWGLTGACYAFVATCFTFRLIVLIKIRSLFFEK